MLAVALAAACAPKSEVEGGIGVVDNPAPDPEAPAFRLSAEPVIAVGGLNDDERYEILRFTDATFTASGQLIVATGGGPRYPTVIRVFAPPGRFVRQIGRPGQGPGEFQSISMLSARAGDSLLVVDPGLRRLTLFDSIGTVVSTTRYDGGRRCCFSGGASLHLSAEGPSLDAIEPGDPISRDSIVLSISRLDGDSTVRDTILTVPWFVRPICLTRSTRPPRRGGAPLCQRSIIPPFSPNPSVAMIGDEIVYGDGSRYEYRVYSSDGSLRRTVRAATSPAPITSDDIDRAREGWVGPGGDASPLAAVWRQLRLPETHPAYGTILGGDDGSVWVGSATRYTEDRWWARFDRDGRLLGTLRTPAGHGAVRFTGDQVILSRHDPDSQTFTLFVHRIEPVASGPRP